MKLSITSNANKVSMQIKKHGQEVSGSIRKALSITAQSGINIIQERTSKGMGYKDGKFKPYTEQYAAYRVKKGRGTLPNLEFERQMMSSITSRADSEKAVFDVSRRIAADRVEMEESGRGRSARAAPHLRYDRHKVDVCEIFSPPRATRRLRERRGAGGWSLDLETVGTPSRGRNGIWAVLAALNG